MQSAAGYLTLVQEERFQLACDDGGNKLFVLAHDAPLDVGELQELERRGAHLEVEFDDPANLIAHTAHAVRELPPAPR